MTKDYCKMEFKKDEQGKDVLLKDGKFQVMMEWEKPYMEACIDALKPQGDVLEVGFGLGYSATHIQSYHPKSHTIIEYHPDVAKRARKWAEDYPNVTIVEDTWQNALAKLGVFDCIFFDDYPLHSEKQMQTMQQGSRESDLLLKQGEQLLQDVEKTLPFLKEIKYSDDDLQGLMQEVLLEDKKQVQHFVCFLEELAQRGQISVEQMQKMLHKLIDEKRMVSEELEKWLKKTEAKEPFCFSNQGDRLFAFLSECLRHHMRHGSRFSCFLSGAQSKFEDKQFFEEIITNPYLDYHEEAISIDVPENCDYFKGSQALVITITKLYRS